MANALRTGILLAALTALFIWIGNLVGGRGGMMIAFILAIIMNVGSYWFSDKIVLRSYGAEPLEESQAPGLFSMVRELANQAGLPMPKVAIIEDSTPNAFATGRNPEHAVVAVTRGIVDLLSPRELRGVIGHELAHVKHRDILIGSIAATLAGAVMMIANFAQIAAMFGGARGDDEDEGPGVLGLIITAIIAPVAAMLIQMGISRSREYLADKGGATFARDPEALASALEKMAGINQQQPMESATQATAHMCIVNPLSGGGIAGLFSTHPPIPERAARLRAMGGAFPGGVAVPPPPPPPAWN